MGEQGFEYGTDYGTLRVFVTDSMVRDIYPEHGGRQKIEIPQVIVTSKPDLKYDSRGWLRYRGRDYLIETGYALWPDNDRWRHATETYTCGANRRVGESGLTNVSFDSGPSRWLYELAAEARDAFASEHPAWGIDSMIERRAYERGRADRKREDAEREAAKQEAEARRLDREIAALRAERGA